MYYIYLKYLLCNLIPMFITPYVFTHLSLSDPHPNKRIDHTSLFRGLQQIIQFKKKSLKREIN